MFRPLEMLACAAILSQVLFTAHVAFQIVKIDVTPVA